MEGQKEDTGKKGRHNMINKTIRLKCHLNRTLDNFQLNCEQTWPHLVLLAVRP